MSRVLVCGGRRYADREWVWKVLDEVQPTLLICGGAKGADALAAEYAEEKDIPLMIFPAHWKHGKAAGPVRNGWMIEFGKPDQVVAFPGGRGTDNMVRQTTKARIPMTIVLSLTVEQKESC